AGASTPPRSRLRNTLMAVEVALAVVVLLAAGIFLRAFMQTRNEDTGFRRDGVLLAAYDFSGRNVGEAATRAFTATLLERVRALPGIESAIAADLRQVVCDIDPELPVYDVRTLSDHIEANLIFRRIPARMFMVLAPLLLLLAAIGIYAVVAYAVTLRTTEIGVRLALGATASRLVAQFVGEHLAVIGVGALAGWLLVFAVQVDVFTAPVDPAVFA